MSQAISRTLWINFRRRIMACPPCIAKTSGVWIFTAVRIKATAIANREKNGILNWNNLVILKGEFTFDLIGRSFKLVSRPTRLLKLIWNRFPFYRNTGWLFGLGVIMVPIMLPHKCVQIFILRKILSVFKPDFIDFEKVNTVLCKTDRLSILIFSQKGKQTFFWLRELRSAK